jgi:aminoglycoside phosphotransferase family enzyme
MLDRLIESRGLREGELAPLVRLLARFYRSTPPVAMQGPELRGRIAGRVARNTAELCAAEGGLPVALVEDIGNRQLAFLERHADMLDARVALGKIVEGHGDLRPEHVCLEPQPQVIDCLEFSRKLRIVDAAEELGFLALECERLGAARVKRELFDTYGEISGDRPDARLVDFHQSVHACVRATLALWHLREPGRDDREKWLRRAGEYLALAARHIEAALAS